MSCGIYAIVNILNGIMYVGSSFEIEDRWYGGDGHFTHLRKGDHDNKYFQRAFNKYGEEAFVAEILELTSRNKKKKLRREQYYIDLAGMENLYNESPRAGGGSGPCSEKTKEKIKRKIKEMWSDPELWKGRIVSEKIKEKIKETCNDPEFRKRQSEKQKETWSDPEFRKKQSGKTPWNKGLTKKVDARLECSEKTKEKI
ncbi:hypothetical protein LCGC14_1118210 [marine sediment metagenome]|uniref:GIY-YIG domain-containing protein n=1 Tax=marine sediment metagenome TaxID=412755 RepID=A0A0F9QAM5_9ZZZZ